MRLTDFQIPDVLWCLCNHRCYLRNFRKWDLLNGNFLLKRSLGKWFIIDSCKWSFNHEPLIWDVKGGELVVSPIDGTTKYLNVFPERFAPRRKAGAGERWTGPVPVLFPPGLGGSSAPRGCPDPWDTLCLQRCLPHCGSALLLPVLRC